MSTQLEQRKYLFSQLKWQISQESFNKRIIRPQFCLKKLDLNRKPADNINWELIASALKIEFKFCHNTK